MPLICGADCNCKIKLDAAMAALQKSATLLSASVYSGHNERIDKCFAFFLADKSTLFAAMDYYKAHLESSVPKWERDDTGESTPA